MKGKQRITSAGLFVCLAALAAGCGPEPDEPAAGPEAAGPVPATAVDEAASDCAPEGELTYICGLRNAEDILALGDSGLLLASGMSSGDITGHLYLIDPAEDSYRELIFGGGFNAVLDSVAFPECPGLINLSSFSMHGLALREYADNKFDLYATSHGAREAIEIFNVDISGQAPALTWRGCVMLPENTFSNSVAIFTDGGFVTTKMMDPAVGFGPITAGEISGLVYEWHPGGPVTAVAGTELSGANGIALSADERYMYVAALGGQEVVRFDRSLSPVGKEVVPLDISPDNVRWGAEGKLLTAGNNYVSPQECSGPGCATGWSVVEIDAATLEASRVGGFDQNVAIQGVSSALQVGDHYWVGTFNGDRVAYFPR